MPTEFMVDFTKFYSIHSPHSRSSALSERWTLFTKTKSLFVNIEEARMTSSRVCCKEMHVSNHKISADAILSVLQRFANFIVGVNKSGLI
jgi:hypothetical protein